jgi:predicted nucleic acid-binding protein
MLLIDLNVVLDVVQARAPHYQASANVIDRVVSKNEQGALAAHAVTTVHYLVARYRDRKTADETVGWLLDRFQIATVGNHELRRAHALAWPDFEDAVVASAAESAECSCIVTRNVKDFKKGSLPAYTPEEYLAFRDIAPG